MCSIIRYKILHLIFFHVPERREKWREMPKPDMEKELCVSGEEKLLSGVVSQ